MEVVLAARMGLVQPSQTLAITARAAALKKEGRNVISLGAGEPDFDTPETVREAGIQAIKDGFTRYTAVDGIPLLKQAIAEKFRRDNSLLYDLNQILVSVGGKQSFFNLVQALINPGDEVIIPAPYWVSYPDIVQLAGGVPKIVFSGIHQGFKLLPDQLKAGITPRTKLLVLNSPSNPTGAVYKKSELFELSEVLKKYPNVWIASDDMYEHILWADEPFCNILNICPELSSRTVVLNGVSKAYAMTGWRIGYAAGPAPLIEAMTTVQSQCTSNATSISQVAAAAALSGDQSAVSHMRGVFQTRHELLLHSLRQLPGFSCTAAEGAFYSFPDVSTAILAKNFKNDLDFSEFLLQKAEVAVVPGSAFGAPGYIRLSFATHEKNLTEAVSRIQSVL